MKKIYHHCDSWSAICSLVVMVLFAAHAVHGQVAGDSAGQADTAIVFTPVVPLIGEESRSVIATQGAGVNLVFSGSGWAVGGYYVTNITSLMSLSADGFFASRRNTDEFDDAYYGNIPVVSTKLNRVFVVPLSVSIRYRLFEESLQESFRPYITAGISASAVIVTPYLRLMSEGDDEDRYYDYFESFGHAQTTFQPGGFIGLGSSFGSTDKGSAFGVSVRYYFIPYPEPGVESIRGLPMTDVGGVFITLSIGSAW